MLEPALQPPLSFAAMTSSWSLSWKHRAGGEARQKQGPWKPRTLCCVLSEHLVCSLEPWMSPGSGDSHLLGANWGWGPPRAPQPPWGGKGDHQGPLGCPQVFSPGHELPNIHTTPCLPSAKRLRAHGSAWGSEFGNALLPRAGRLSLGLHVQMSSLEEVH